MNKELFGVFGDRATFRDHRSDREFDRVVSGDAMTVGVRDVGLNIPGRSATYEGDRGCCVVWGEAYVPDRRATNAARWLYERYAEEGRSALAHLNGSYLAAVDHDGEAVVATDPIRSWECFYTDEADQRVFGSDSVAVARAIDEPRIDKRSLLEFVYIGVVLGTGTMFEHLERVPFDGYLRPDDAGELDRFVYDPRPADEFDPVEELADRLRAALARRSRQPGTKGMLLSGGYDSRLILSQVPDVERCYTVGDPSAQEVAVARKIADQYDAEHVAFEPNDRYIHPGEEKTRYSQGIKESLHVHHAGYDDEMEADTMYHGLLCDIYLCGHFVERRSLDVLGKEIPLGGLDPDPDPVEVLLDRFGYSPDQSEQFAEVARVDDRSPAEFVREAVAEEFEKGWSRATGTQNAIDLCGVRNQPSIPFRAHLADNYLESFFVADTGLLNWHLQTPPEHRSKETFVEACRRLDPDILRHRPPDRPHDSQLLNEAERFVRRKLPFVTPFESAWPDRRELYDRHDMDAKLFPAQEYLHDLPVREKLRLNDVRSWMDRCLDVPVSATQVVQES
ncbi:MULTISPECIES: asparagine synthase-related protein [Halorussus]|uniref:asparagine synthase-related protein n=1 Tax=Halorussus TaxID=1070314 RepID=UPI00209ECD9A|nr:asparagine synthase-related protein [Halorussus vallis]USZ78409.1 asparagine synthase-related protein [Halorussus vallis]